VRVQYNTNMSLADPIEYESQLKAFAGKFKAPIPWETVEAVRSAVEESNDEVTISVTLPKKTATKVLALIDIERTKDAVVIPAQSTFTLADAAAILRMPKDDVESLIIAGDIPAKKSHLSWKIKAKDIVHYLESQKEQRRDAARRLALMTAP